VSRQIRHGQSHASLLRDVSAAGVPQTRSRLDAIVVPAARPSSALQDVISLSATLSVPLVVLCSRQAHIEQVAQRVEKTFGARALIVEVDERNQLLDVALLTSDREFRDACADRSSDLSVKRNIGLLLGRLQGWSKILFIDDDISHFRPSDIERLTGYLDRHAVASMVSRHFPDNSVVCHARRLAGLQQDVFVSGAVLGVNLHYPKLSFFPDIYNEDWFFFARNAAERSLPKIGEVRQAKYPPFADPGRAEREEFGDLLAEGLYALFEYRPGWDFKEQLRAAALVSYWEHFKELRLRMIRETDEALSGVQLTADPANYLKTLQAQESLRFAEKRATGISADLCVDFLDKWQEDEVRWQQVLRRYKTVLSERDALAELGLTKWISCGYGVKSMSSGTYTAAEPEPDLTSPGAVEQGLDLTRGVKAQVVVDPACLDVVVQDPDEPVLDHRLPVGQVLQDRA
jgi:hypothetical protein